MKSVTLKKLLRESREIRFIHIREGRSYRSEELAEKLSRMYGREVPSGLTGDPSPNGGTTVAFKILPNNDGSPEKIAYSVAFCRDNDHYNKVRSQQISAGRLLCKRQNKVQVITYQPGVKVSDQVYHDLQDLCEAGAHRFLA